MSPSRFSPMELKATNDLEDASCSQRLHRDMWPLDEVDPSKARFPCCIVWTPLPIVSWLAPFFGHVGICREDGAILDFSGSNFVNIDKFAFGSVARYLQLDREQVWQKPYIDMSLFYFNSCGNAHQNLPVVFTTLSFFHGERGRKQIQQFRWIFRAKGWGPRTVSKQLSAPLVFS